MDAAPAQPPSPLQPVVVVSGTTTIQDFNLDPAVSSLVEGKLEGTVTGLGYCDADPAPLEGAEVLVEGWVTETITVPTLVLTEDFEPPTWPPPGWFLPPPPFGFTWFPNPFAGRPNFAGGDGECANADSQVFGPTDTELWSPSMDLSSFDAATLEFVAAYQDLAPGNGNYFAVDVSANGGGIWTNVLFWDQDHDPTGPGELVSIDLTPYLSPAVMVKFHAFATSVPSTYAQVDQVRLTGFTEVDVPVIGSWTLETDENGTYAYWLDEAYSPLTVTVTYTEHVIGVATDVALSGGVTTTEDFDLRWLQPCVSADPALMAATVRRGTSLTQTMIIYNDGAVETPFEMLEQEGTLWPPVALVSIPANHDNYTQGMNFEKETGVLNMAAYNNSADHGELRIIDTSTGNSALVGAFPGDAETDWLAFETGGLGSDVPWLEEDPQSGILGADSSLPITITFTAFPTMTVGVYTATMTALTDDPMHGSAIMPMTMTVVDKPTCSFFSSNPDVLGEETAFSNTTDEGFLPTIYQWDFGDGSPISAAENPAHTYAQPSLYTAVLTATNQYGEDMCTGTVSIEGVLGGFVSNSPVILGDPVVFTNTTLANPPITYYFWTFGDGGDSEETHPTHTYADTGVYTVTLWAVNTLRAPMNVWDIYQDTIQVLQPAALTVSPITLAVTLEEGETITNTLTLGNLSEDVDLIWSLTEAPGVTWLGELPISGAIVPLGSSDVEITFNATLLSAGLYSTTLKIASNDPDRPQVDVEVTLTVLPFVHQIYLPIVIRH